MPEPTLFPEWYDYERLAAITGMSRHGLSVKLFRARRARQHRDSTFEAPETDAVKAPGRPSELPEPDAVLASAPLWRESSIRQWLRARVFDNSVRIKLDPEATLAAQKPVMLTEERRLELLEASVN